MTRGVPFDVADEQMIARRGCPASNSLAWLYWLGLVPLWPAVFLGVYADI